jgi:hypothetical protein
LVRVRSPAQPVPCRSVWRSFVPHVRADPSFSSFSNEPGTGAVQQAAGMLTTPNDRFSEIRLKESERSLSGSWRHRGGTRQGFRQALAGSAAGPARRPVRPRTRHTAGGKVRPTVRSFCLAKRTSCPPHRRTRRVIFLQSCQSKAPPFERKHNTQPLRY